MPRTIIICRIVPVWRINSSCSAGGFCIANESLECGFTLDCFSLNDVVWYPSFGSTCEISVGIKQTLSLAETSRVYPQPFSNYASLELNEPESDMDLLIYNLYGQQVKSRSNISGNKIRIDREYLSRGIYFYEIKHENQIISTGKLMIAD